MTFIDNLKNVSVIEFNESLINNSDELVTNFISNPTNMLGNYWFIIIILVFWIYNLARLMQKEETKDYDIWRSILISSGWSVFISGTFVLFQLTTTIIPLIWFGSLLFVSWIVVRNLKAKGF